MSHISTGAEYGLHCLLYLVPQRPEGTSVRDLADLQGVPFEYLAKVFTKLHKAGLVNATEGVRGGFVLARPADQITVLDVVTAIDGDKALFDCQEIRARCAVFGETAPPWATNGVCAIHAVMKTAETRMRESLAGVSLSDLASQVAAKAPQSYGNKVVAWLDTRAEARADARVATRARATRA